MSNHFHTGIIFDMDNTLLKSTINFPEMKRTVYDLLVQHGICESALQWQRYTASQLIEMGRQSCSMSDELEQKIWEAVTAIETAGMHGAVLEDHVMEVLSHLHRRCHLVILTNNAYIAAVEALQETGIGHYFDEIVAREQMAALKPSLAGIAYILNKYPDVPHTHWTMVGDSWIDGKAAQDANVTFIAYKGNVEEMQRQQVTPTYSITNIEQLLQLNLYK